MKIIFLDIDGVLNCEQCYREGLCRRNDEYGQDFYPPSANLLNQLIEETGAKIVISSTWRMSGLEIMQNMWRDRKMAGEVIDITPSFNHIRIHDEINGVTINEQFSRGNEINAWLDSNGFSQIFWSVEYQQEAITKSDIENFIIIDDDSDMLYNQKDHFVHVKPSPRNRKGFHEEHYQEAKRILETSLFELHGLITK